MTFITDIRHFLGDDGELADLPPEALDLCRYLTSIIEAATDESGGYDAGETEIRCRNIDNARRCHGDIEVILLPGDSQIEWQCELCGEDGVISGWEGTKWDKRVYVRH